MRGFIFFVIGIFGILCVLPIAISISFYFLNKKQSNVLFRICSSIHGLLVAILYIAAGIIESCLDGMDLLIYNGNFNFIYQTIFIYKILFILPVLSIVLSFFWFKGNKYYHLLHILTLLFLLIYLHLGEYIILMPIHLLIPRT
jgi:hypothetical protein